jgi:hypothetical protein
VPVFLLPPSASAHAVSSPRPSCEPLGDIADRRQGDGADRTKPCDRDDRATPLTHAPNSAQRGLAHSHRGGRCAPGQRDSPPARPSGPQRGGSETRTARFPSPGVHTRPPAEVAHASPLPTRERPAGHWGLPQRGRPTRTARAAALMPLACVVCCVPLCGNPCAVGEAPGTSWDRVGPRRHPSTPRSRGVHGSVVACGRVRRRASAAPQAPRALTWLPHVSRSRGHPNAWTA